MPHTPRTWKEAMQDDPTWKKAVKRMIKRGYSEAELQKQHEAWQVRPLMSKSEK
jgi:hypothetical protein